MQTLVFTFEQQDTMGDLTTVEINGQVWFLVNDVCNVLGLTNVTEAVRDLDEDEKLTSVILKSGQNRKVLLVNESGLYSLIFKSKKPSAKRFRKWITSEVLPQIRRTGSYGIDRAALPNFMKRFQLNWAATEPGYFSVIAMLYPTLYAALERLGYSIPDRGHHEKEIRPDTSVGLCFSKYLQQYFPHLADKHKPYIHTFPDGSQFPCRQYENELMGVFVNYVEKVWIPERAYTYFATRDLKALDFLPKLIGPRAA